MKSKRRKQEMPELDTETTIADMNVDGFSWYNPAKKAEGNKKERLYLTRKEKRAITKAAFSALLPLIGIIAVAFLVVFLLARLWLGS